MSAVRSRSWIATGVSGVFSDLVLVPSGRTALVKKVVIYSWSGAAQQVHLAARTATGIEVIFGRHLLQPDATWTLEGLFVFGPLERLKVNVGGAGAGWHGYAAGALLFGAPE